MSIIPAPAATQLGIAILKADIPGQKTITKISPEVDEIATWQIDGMAGSAAFSSVGVLGYLFGHAIEGKLLAAGPTLFAGWWASLDRITWTSFATSSSLTTNFVGVARSDAGFQRLDNTPPQDRGFVTFAGALNVAGTGFLREIKARMYLLLPRGVTVKRLI